MKSKKYKLSAIVFYSVRLLLGLALLFLTLSNYYWQERYVGVSNPENSRPWYSKIHWKLNFLSGLFFILFLILIYLFFKLSGVQEFL